MDDLNKAICRLCLEITPTCECEIVDDVKKNRLKFLLINIDFSISDNAVACNKCEERLQEWFDFKSRITTFVNGDMKVDIKQVFERKSSVLCNLCMSLVEGETVNYTSDWKDGTLFEKMMISCLPEVDLKVANESLICKSCLGNVKGCYEFMKGCQEIEQRIERYCRVVGRNTTLILEDVLQFKDCDEPVIIKKERVDVEYVDVNTKGDPRIEDSGTVKEEEINIKEEIDNTVETSDSHQLNDYGCLGNDGFSKLPEYMVKSDLKGKEYVCPKCPYASTRSDNFKRHMRDHSDKEAHKCFLCPFVADAPLLLRAHMASHRGPTKAFGCTHCPYETDYKSNLVQHFFKHKDMPEKEMQNCPLCPFKSKYKNGLAKHYRVQHDTNIEMYKCEECGFSTKHRNNMVRHQLLHKNPEEIPRYKCDKCEYETKNKQCMNRHMMTTHEELKIAVKFKCEKCPYQADWQDNLRRHMIIHSERKYSCEMCSYLTNVRRNLLSHQRVHQKDGERHMFKCTFCSYKAKSSISIRDHLAETHADVSQTQKLKCAHCPYETSFKQSLSRHIQRLHANKDLPMFKCELCDYMTNFKQDLHRHSFIHRDAALQCNQCSFRTKHKRHLRTHMYVHDPTKKSAFKCDQCKFNTTTKWRLSLHTVKHTKLKETVVYYCATCDFQTKRKVSLKVHVRVCVEKKRNDGILD